MIEPSIQCARDEVVSSATHIWYEYRRIQLAGLRCRPAYNMIINSLQCGMSHRPPFCCTTVGNKLVGCATVQTRIQTICTLSKHRSVAGYHYKLLNNSSIRILLLALTFTYPHFVDLLSWIGMRASTLNSEVTFLPLREYLHIYWRKFIVTFVCSTLQ
jgi:hypothetical protein